jgi:hypothetical protein
MCRKLTLTGWVLLISERAEQARVLVAILVSVGFLTLRLSIKPLLRFARHCDMSQTTISCDTLHVLCRNEDMALAMLIEMALICIYICVLLIKSCEGQQSDLGIPTCLQLNPLCLKALSTPLLAVSSAVCNTFGFGDNANGAAQLHSPPPHNLTASFKTAWRLFKVSISSLFFSG